MLTPASSMTSRAESDSRRKTLYRVGGVAALFSAAIIPVELVVFIAWGQPDSALGWFDMFRENELVGLLAFELLFVVNAVVGLATTLSLYVVLRRVNESLMAISLVLGLVEAITIILARPAVEMLYLSERYAAATTDAQRAAFLAAGEAMWAVTHGTAFHVGYNLFSVFLLIVAVVMLQSGVFGRLTAYAGILAALLNWGLYVPGIGVFLSVLGVFPFFVVWNVLVGRKLLQLGRAESGGRDAPVPERRNSDVVGRLALGVLERPYGLGRPRRPRVRRMGAVPVLQRGEERKLVRLRVLARCRFSPPGHFGPKEQLTRKANDVTRSITPR